MPRPIRIEYKNAFYHVMNRGRARSNIFLNEEHYLVFIDLIKESYKRFNFRIHAYCLMPNHYHLLIQTYDANLGRVMRHINGVYTQRFNKLQKIDGSLFRGRYKAILVEEGDYLFELSRYIHKNPIEIKDKNKILVNSLKEHKWSSYPSYLDLCKTPNWLNKSKILSMFKNDKDILKRYELFVDHQNSDRIKEFFQKKNQGIILGSRDFKEKLCTNLTCEVIKAEKIKSDIYKNITIDQIIYSIAEVFDVTNESILSRQQGRPKRNYPRNMAIYLIQKYKNYTLEDIAKIFDLKGQGSVSYVLFTIKEELRKGLFESELKKIEKCLYFIQ